MKSSTRRTRHNRMRIDEVEARILYSADALALLDPGLAGNMAEVRMLEAPANSTPPPQPALARTEQAASESRRHEIVFIDVRVPDAASLVADIAAQSDATRQIDIIELDPNRDGIEQISAALAGRHDINAIHLISHGADGRVELGNRTLSMVALGEQAGRLALWGNALTEQADLLIYGCDVAATANGQALINALARLTGADVAASDDATGNAPLGGDWVLEFRTGVIEAPLAPSELAQYQWSNLLATALVTTVLDTTDGDTSSIAALNGNPGTDGVISLREAIIAANNTAGADTINFNIAGAGPHVINVASALPAIGEALIINGLSEPDYVAGTPVVRVDGAAAGFGGLSIGAGGGGSTIQGLMITGFTGDGINVASGANNVTIADNWIGTAGNFTTGVGNGGVGNSDDGIDMAGSNAIITRNVITNNGDEGLDIKGSGVTAHVVQGNIIGLDPNGSSGGGNFDVGIAILTGTGNTIGGTSVAARNVVSMNIEGIEISTSDNVVQGNYIGTDVTGTVTTLGNRGGNGVQLQGGSTNNRVGGTAVGAGNLIAFNASDGVDVVNGSGHLILGNIIHSNTLLGINLGTAGVTANDAAPDSDSGANNLQNFPVLTRVVTNASDRIAVGGTLASVASTSFRIEIFSSVAGDSSGNGEGQTYLGFVNVLTDGAGNVTWGTEIFANVAAGAVISATATKLDVAGNPVETSEFAANITAVNQTLIVTNTSDIINGTTTSVSALISTPGGDGISLREAIAAANNTAGIDLITFNIPLSDAGHVYYRDNAVAGTFSAPVATTLADASITDFDADYAAGTARSWHRITLGTTSLDATQAVIIDGSTQAGYDASKGPIIEINAAAVTGGDANAIALTTGASTIRALVINRASDNAIEIDTGAASSVIVGNYIGTDVSGTKALGNSTVGTWGAIGVKTNSVVIGGVTAADRNLISGNLGYGIEFYNSASGATVQGNYIGTTVTGSGSLGNTSTGIYFHDSAADNAIGGTAANAGNLIANNGGDGIWADNTAGTGNQFIGNSIYSNSELGIDLENNGVTNNDNNDGDGGANDRQNFPVLTSVAADGSQVIISGSLNSEASKTYRIEFFANTANDNEGQRYLGYTTVATPSGTPYTVSFTATLNAAVTAGEYVTATATSPTNNTSEFSVQLAAFDGMGIWANNNTTPEYALWNGTGFGSVANSATVGEWQFVKMAEAPTRAETIAVGMDVNGVIAGQMWNGSTWTAFSFNDLADISTTGFKSFQLAYERQSGDAMLVWDNGSTGSASLSYRTWNGAVWSAAQTIATPEAGEAVQLSLAADPNSDSMVLAVGGTSAAIDYALVWNGSSWGNGATLDTSSGADRTEIQAVYEAHSGRAMVFYDADGSTNAINYNIWDGTSWGAQQSLPAPAGIGASSDANFGVVTGDPNSNRIALAVVTDSSEIWISVWDGAAWSSQVAATSNAAIITAPSVGLAFEHDSGDLLAAYGNAGSNNVFYRTWSAQAGWSSELTGPNVGGVANSVLLYADTNSNRIMLGVHDAQQDVNFAEWTGSAWNAVSGDMTGNTGTAGGFEPLGFVWFDNNRTPVISAAAFSTPENSTAVGTVTATDADGNALVYSISGGPDAARFTIATSTGVLSFVGAPDFERPADAGGNNVYDVIVRASDQTGGTDSTAVTVTITAVNDAPTYSMGDGRVTTTIAAAYDAATATVIQPDGKILIAGAANNGSNNDFFVARYTVDGLLDTTFGGGAGYTITAFGAGEDFATSIALQADGKILLAGNSFNGTNTDFAVARYNSNGTLDTTFDTDGKVTITFSTSDETATGIAVQADGKIVVGGYSTLAGNIDFAVARLNANGSLDTTFDTDGKVTTAIGSGTDQANGLVIQADGKIVLAGYSHNGTDEDVALVRYNTNGSLDTTFDGDGRYTAVTAGFDLVSAVALQADGKIVVAVQASVLGNADFALGRFNTNGSLDTTLGGTGGVTTAIGAAGDYAKAITIQADGKILVAGESFNGSNNDVALVRYNTNGTLDSSFDGDGKLTTAIGSATDSAAAVAVQVDGKIVAAGAATFANGDAAVVRYNADGSLDTRFDTLVTTLDGAPTFIENGAAVVLDANVQIFDAELSALNNFNGATLTLARNGGANAQDVFSATGTLSALTQAGSLVVGGTPIGTVTTNSAGTLLLTFSASATNVLVNSTLQQITYSNTSDAPPATTQINWTFNDGNSGSQGTGGALTATGSTTVTITPVNDAPVGTNTTVTTLEDGIYTFTVADFGFTDSVDVPANALLSVKVTTLPGAGSLALSGTAVASGDFIPVANITAGNLKFTPVADANGTGYTSFTFQVQDDGGTANGGVNLDAVARTMTVNVVAVNDAPVLTSLPATISNLTVLEDAALTALFPTAISFAPGGGADEAGQTLSYAVTAIPSAAVGNVYLADGTTLVSNAAYTLAEIQGMLFKPTANASGGTGFQFNVTDNGGVLNGGLNSLSAFILLTVTPVNDAPTLTATALNPVFTEAAGLGTQAAAVTVYSAAAASTIESGQSITGLTFTVGGLADGANEVIVVNGTTMTLGANSSGTTTINSLTYNTTVSGANATVVLSGGTLSLVATQTLVNTITYQNTNTDSPTGGSRIFTLTQVRDSGGVLNGGVNTNTLSIASTVTVNPVNDAPVVTAGGTLAYTEQAAAAAIDATITIADADDTQITGVTVTITSAVGGDTFGFTAQNGITVASNVGGVLTLTGTTTRANYETALRSVTFSSSSDDPTVDNTRLSRTITWAVTDANASGVGAATSTGVTSTVNLTAVNDAPAITAGGTLAYTEQAAAAAIDATITISDLDDTQIAGATVTISSPVAGDALGFTAQNGITVASNVGGVLTLTGTTTRANYQTALRSVTFSSTSDDPTVNNTRQTRTVTWAVTDANSDAVGAQTSTGVASTINVTAVNDTPVVTAGATLAYTEQAAAAAIDATITINDLDDTQIASATVTITSPVAGDTLGFTAQNGITVASNVGGVLTLTGTTTRANYETALRSVTFSSTSDDPTADNTRLTRTVTWAVTDANSDAVGAQTSTGVTSTINVTAVNDAPVVIAGGTLAYTEQATATAIDSTLTIADTDDTQITGATITITSPVASDTLGFTAQNGIAVASNVGGVLTLTGTTTLANYQAALRSVTFSSTSDDPTVDNTRPARIITWAVTDANSDVVGAQTSAGGVTSTINVTAVNDTPVVTAGATLAYTEQAAAAAIDASITISDLDDTQIIGATVTITSPVAGDTLGFTAQSGITVASNVGGVLTLTGTTTLANYQTALRSVTFSSTSDDPTVDNSRTTRTVTWAVTDANSDAVGAATSTGITSTANITAVADAPVVTGGGTLAYAEQAAAAIDTTITITDVDDTQLAGATITISANLTSGDVLGFANTGSITGVYTAATGTLVLSGTDTLANYRTALRSVTFNSTSDDPTVDNTRLTRTVTWAVTDANSDAVGSQTSAGGVTSTINVTAVNDAPVVTAGGTLAYTEQAAAAAIDASITINDVDDTQITGATVTIASPVAGDTLGFTAQNGISVASNVGGVLTLTGTTTLANYQTALRSVTFNSTSDDPTVDNSRPSRTITWALTDANSDAVGAQTSTGVTSTINVTAINDTPVVTAGATLAYTEQAAAAAIDATLTIGDLDDTQIAGATVTIASPVAGDTLGFTAQNGITVASNVGGVLTLTGTTTRANYETALRSVTFNSTLDDPTVDNSRLSRTVTWAVTDANSDAVGAQTSTGVTSTINVTAVNDTPVIVAGATLAYTEQAAAAAIDATLTIADADDTQITGATVTISSPVAGDTLSFTTQNGITVVSNVGGVLTLTGTATRANYETALRSVTFNSTSDDPTVDNTRLTRTVTWAVIDANSDAVGAQTSTGVTSTINVTAVNDKPVVTAGASLAYTEQAAAAPIDATITIADADDTQIAGATVTITSPVAGDTLGFTAQNGITVVSNVGGVLALTGTTTLANYQTALRSVTFNSTSDDPTVDNTRLTRTIIWAVTDANSDAVGAQTSAGGVTSTINVTAVNDTPVATAGGTLAYTEQAAAAAIDATITIADADDTQIAGAAVTITSPVAGDTLGFTAQNGITVASNVGGVLTLTGTTTLANYQAALRSVTFSSTSDDPTVDNTRLTRTVTWAITDANSDAVGAQTSAGGVTSTINVTAVNDTPVATAGGTLAYTEQAAAAAIDATITIADADDTQITGATVTIASPVAGDTLGFTTQNGITVASNVGGVLTLTGTTTRANYQAALRSVTFNSTSDDPTVDNTRLTRTITWAVTDANSDAIGAQTSAGVTSTINVTAVNDTPVVTAGATPAYTEQAVAAAIDATITISDLDDTQIAGATVTLTSPVTGDTLGFTAQNGITVASNVGGVLTLTGTTTLANYQTALRSVTFSSTSDDPTVDNTRLTRTITWAVTDANSDAVGAQTGAGGVTSTINVTAVNDAPVITVGGSLTYTEQAAAAAIDATLTITDADDTQITGATVTLTSPVAGDALGFTAQNGITVASNVGGVLTLTGTATRANYETALRSVTFNSASDDPTADNTRLTRTVTWAVTDANSDAVGAQTSTGVTSTINVTAVNDTPVATAGGTLAYTEQGAAAAIDATLTISDLDDAQITGATVTIGSPVAGDTLGFTAQNGIAVVSNVGGVLTLTGTTTRANYETALRSVTFNSTSDDPTVDNARVTRTITWAVTDANSDAVGAQTSTGVTSTVNLTAVNDVPVVTAGGSLAYTEQAAAAAIDATITISDLDDTQIAGATVTITSPVAGDTLGFTAQNGITVASNVGGVLTLTGTTTLANYQAALRSVTFNSTSDDPTVDNTRLTRTVTWAVTDANSDAVGARTSTGVISTINVTAVNDTPVVAAGGTLTYTEQAAAAAIDATVTISDLDDTQITGATVTITSPVAGDTLSFTTQNGITLASNVGGVLTLTGTTTRANYETALRSVTFNSTSDDPTVDNTRLTRTVTWAVTDANSDAVGAQTSTGVTSTINVTAVNDTPVVTAGGTLAYTEQAAAAPIDATITISDLDDTQITGATVTISSPVAGDTLGFTAQNGITVASNVGGVLTLTGTTTLANYQTALRSVTFNSTSDDPTVDNTRLTRTVTWAVTDANSDAVGARTSAGGVVSSVNVTAVNDTPVVTAGGTLAYTEQAVAAAIDPTLTIADADDTQITGATVTITSPVAGDALSFTTQNGITVVSNVGGVLTLTGTTTRANYETALRSVTFSSTSDDPTVDNTRLTRTITWAVTDANSDVVGAQTSAGVTSTVNVTAVNDTPVVTAGATLAYTEQAAAAAIDATITIADADDTQITGATISLTSPVAGDTLGFTAQNGISVASNVGGVLTLTGTTTRANYETALRSVTFSSSSDDPTVDNTRLTRTVTWAITDANSDAVGAQTSTVVTSTINVTAVNDKPVVTAGASLAYTEQAVAAAIDATITIADADDTQINGATVTITSPVAGDTLSFTAQNGITVASNVGGVLTLTGTTTRANYETALRSVTFSSTSDDPTVDNTRLTRTITWAVTDANSDAVGAQTSTGVTSTINVTAVNDTPAVTAGATLAYAEQAAAAAIDATITISDLDDTQIAGATVTITSPVAGDTLSFTTQNGITVASNVGGVLTLTGTTTLANYQTALRSVTFSSTSDDPTVNNTRLTRTVTWAVTDANSDAVGARTSAGGVTSTINVTAVNDAPVVTAGATLAYTEQAAAAAIDTTLTITDADDTQITGATVTLTSPVAGDTLGFTAQNGITVVSNVGGVLTLTGTTTLANYQTALRSVTFSSTSDDPTLNNARPTRTLTWAVTDANSDAAGAATSAGGVISTINVTAVNDAPVVTAASLTLNEGQSVTLAAGNFGITDPDNTSFTYTVSAASGGIFQLTSAVGTPIATFTSADLIGGLVQFVDDGNEVAPSFSVKVNDGGLDSNVFAAAISYTPVNDAPIITAGAGVGLASTTESTTSPATTVNTILAGATWSDADLGAVSGIAVTAIAGSGAWQYSTDGITWTSTGPVAAGNALLLSSTAQIRYVAGSGASTASFSFLAWDQTAGAPSSSAVPVYANPGAGGGAAAYSASAGTASLTVTAIPGPTLGPAPLPPVPPAEILPPTPAPTVAPAATPGQAPAALASASDASNPDKLVTLERVLAESVIENTLVSSAQAQEQSRRAAAGAPQIAPQPIFLIPILDAWELTPFEFKWENDARSSMLPADMRVVFDEASEPPPAQVRPLLTLENAAKIGTAMSSAVFVAWALRGAGVLTSLMVSMPAWRHLDPIPVLAPDEAKPDWDDAPDGADESAVSSLLRRQA